MKLNKNLSEHDSNKETSNCCGAGVSSDSKHGTKTDCSKSAK